MTTTDSHRCSFYVRLKEEPLSFHSHYSDQSSDFHWILTPGAECEGAPHRAAFQHSPSHSVKPGFTDDICLLVIWNCTCVRLWKLWNQSSVSLVISSLGPCALCWHWLYFLLVCRWCLCNEITTKSISHRRTGVCHSVTSLRSDSLQEEVRIPWCFLSFRSVAPISYNL